MADERSVSTLRWLTYVLIGVAIVLVVVYVILPVGVFVGAVPISAHMVVALATLLVAIAVVWLQAETNNRFAKLIRRIKQLEAAAARPAERAEPAPGPETTHTAGDVEPTSL